jgi:hypothetical protein
MSASVRISSRALPVSSGREPVTAKVTGARSRSVPPRRPGITGSNRFSWSAGRGATSRRAHPTRRPAAKGHIFWNEYFRLLDSGETVDVLAIGDSWFHYPFNNLITPLYEVLERPTIFVIGENGARADELAAGAWLANLGRMLVGYPSIRLVCISAGGNDFAGVGDLDDRLLKLDCSGEANAESAIAPVSLVPHSQRSAIPIRSSSTRSLRNAPT